MAQHTQYDLRTVRLTEAARDALRACSELRVFQRSRLMLAAAADDAKRADDVDVPIPGARSGEPVSLRMDRDTAPRATSIDVDFTDEGFEVSGVWRASMLSNRDLGILTAHDLRSLLPDGKRRHVLIADHDPAFCEYLESVLHTSGFAVTVARNSAVAALKAPDAPQAPEIALALVDLEERELAEVRRLELPVCIVDWLRKPFSVDMELVPISIRDAM